MKKIITTFAAILVTASIFLPQQASAQTPEKMSYQAVIRNGSDDLVTETAVGMQLSILQGSASGTVVYQETHTPTSNANGLVSVEIGGGTSSDDFSTIDWSAGPYFIKTETDPAGGTNYSITGTSQLMSVPYALYAKSSGGSIESLTSGSILVGDDQDTPVAVSLSGDATLTNDGTLTISDDAITTNKIGDESVTETKLAVDAVTTDKIADGTITTAKILDDVVTTDKIVDASVTDAKLDKTNIPLSGFGAATADIDLGSNKILFANVYPSESDLPSASSYHGMFAHVHGTGKAYYAHAGNWIMIANRSEIILEQILADNNTANDQQIKGLADPTDEQDAATKAYVDGLSPSPGANTGEMLYWDGSAWVTIEASGNEGATLQLIDGVPQWQGGTPPPPPSVTNPTTGKEWMDRNLSASQVATSSTDAAAYGDLYQWGRAADGHEDKTSGNYDGVNSGFPSTATASGNWDGKFITANNGDGNWLGSNQNNTLWQGVNGTNNPCPSGYRLPTQAEWEAEKQSWSSQDVDGAYASPLKLPLAGRRSHTDGTLQNVGAGGNYWSSTVSGGFPMRFQFQISVSAAGTYPATGCSVRCIKD